MKVAVSRAPGEERAVTPIELFFDLVYVFAIGLLSHHLLEHVDLRTGAETVILALAVIYAWSATAWGANWLDPERAPVKLLLVGLMFASLLMSVAIADGDARLVLWGLAIVATQVGAWALHWLPGRGRRIDLDHTDVSAEHLLERFRLFFLIALGETVLTTGAAFVNEQFEVERLLTLVVGFAGTVALWWCYFESAEPAGEEAAERSRDAGSIGWLGTWTLTLVVLALIAIAVGDELAIAHPSDSPTLGFTILAFGGPALFLLAQLFVFRETLGRVPRSRPLALGALAILAVATAPLTQLAAIAASTAVLVAVAIADTARDDGRVASEPV
jgi:low temperature requirement protein LtrA